MQPERRSLAIDIKGTAIDPDSSERVVSVRQADSAQPLYRIFLYLDGPDLPFVRSVTYHLHETFHPPNRKVIRTPVNPRCKLEIWTWGLFEVSADVEDKQGNWHRRRMQLAYNEELKDPKVKIARVDSQGRS